MQILERYFLRDANINLRDAKQDLRDARYALREIECDTPRGLYCISWIKGHADISIHWQI